MIPNPAGSQPPWRIMQTANGAKRRSTLSPRPLDNATDAVAPGAGIVSLFSTDSVGSAASAQTLGVVTDLSARAVSTDSVVSHRVVDCCRATRLPTDPMGRLTSAWTPGIWLPGVGPPPEDRLASKYWWRLPPAKRDL